MLNPQQVQGVRASADSVFRDDVTDLHQLKSRGSSASIQYLVLALSTPLLSVSSGLEVSRGRCLQNLIVQRQIRH